MEQITVTLEGKEVYYTLMGCMYMMNQATGLCQKPGVPEEVVDEQDEWAHAMRSVFNKVFDAQQ